MNYEIIVSTIITAMRDALADILVVKNSELIVSTIITAVAALAAAFAGSWFAFLLNDKALMRKKLSDEVTAGNRAIFILLQQWNDLRLFQTQFIDPARTHELRFVGIRAAFPPMDYERWKFDVNSLSFLLETEYRQCLLDLLLAENKYQTSAKVLNERSKYHFETVQPLLEEAGIIDGGSYPKETYDSALGERVATTISRLTNDTIEQIDETVVFLKATSDKFHEALSKLYPEAKKKKKIINFEPIDKPAPMQN